MKHTENHNEKKHPFTVPDGYFDQLTRDIQARVSEKPATRWMPAPALRWSLAGVAAAIIVAIVVWMPGKNEASPEEMLAEVSDEDLIAYLETMSIEEDELIEMVPEESVDDILLIEEPLDNLELEDEDIDELLKEYELESENI